MSWDVALFGADGGQVSVPSFDDGGTRPIGGSESACLNITYNYGECFRLVGFDLPTLHEATARDTIEPLRAAVEKLGVRRWDDYWAPTPGNAGAALARLLAWAELHPDGSWEVT